MKRIVLLLIAAFLINAHISFSQINPDNVKISTTEISKGLFLIKMYGGNFLVSIGADGILLVDASYEQLGEKLKSEIKKSDNRSVNYLINTHWHFDHAGGNPTFAKETKIISHDSTKKYLSSDKILLGETIKAHKPENLPEITFSDKLILHFNSDTIHLLSFAGGHTGGDIIVYFEKSKILHIGDLAFSDMFPFCDTDSGGDVLKMSENISRIISEIPADVIIITGHGRQYDMNDLKEYEKMISETHKIVNDEIKKGKSLEEVQKANVLENWKEWAVAFTCNDWIEMIYKSVEKK